MNKKCCRNGACTTDSDTAMGLVVFGLIVFWLFLVVLASIVGGYAFEYVLNYWLHKDIPFWADMLGGLFVSPVLIPVTVVTFIISLF